MARPKRRRSDRALRARMHSPGRPTVAHREDRQRFWAAIAKGLTSEDAAIAAEQKASATSDRRNAENTIILNPWLAPPFPIGAERVQQK